VAQPRRAPALPSERLVLHWETRMTETDLFGNTLLAWAYPTRTVYQLRPTAEPQREPG
jgi:hypothetical protein